MKKILFLLITILSFNSLIAQEITFATVGGDNIYLEDFLSIFEVEMDVI